MSPGVIVVGALVLAVTVGFGLTIGAPILGVPIALVVLGGIGAVELRRRHQRLTDVKRFRDEAASKKTDFTARDRQTQVEDGF